MTGASHHSGSLRRELREPPLARRGRRLVDHARELHRQGRAADTESRPSRRNGSRHRGIGYLQYPKEIDAIGIEPGADVAVLVPGQAPPIPVGDLTHGDRLVIGIGGVGTHLDGTVGVIDVAAAIEPGVEGPDEITLSVVDRGREPAFRIVVQLVALQVMTDEAADWGDGVDEDQGEGDVGDGGSQQVPERAEARIERDGDDGEAAGAYGKGDRMLGQTRQQA